MIIDQMHPTLPRNSQESAPPSYMPVVRSEEAVLEIGPPTEDGHDEESPPHFLSDDPSRYTQRSLQSQASTSTTTLHSQSARSPNQEPVILTWGHPAVPTSSSTQYTPLPPIPSSIPFGNPPGYGSSRHPIVPITYSFSQLSFNSMILVPPATEPDSRPVYHISVNLNCFMPSSYITSIHRGGNADGQHVAEFEIGISDKPGTVFIRSQEFTLEPLLTKQGSRHQGIWTWRMPRTSKPQSLFWDCTVEPRVCYFGEARYNHSASDKVCAKFTPARKLRKPGLPVQLAQLQVYPEGQPLFDDILLSALIIERQRLSPSRAIKTMKDLFNYHG